MNPLRAELLAVRRDCRELRQQLRLVKSERAALRPWSGPGRFKSEEPDLGPLPTSWPVLEDDYSQDGESFAELACRWPERVYTASAEERADLWHVLREVNRINRERLGETYRRGGPFVLRDWAAYPEATTEPRILPAVPARG